MVRKLSALGLIATALLCAVALAADRGDLWRIVQTCTLMKAATGKSFPCVEVSPPEGGDVGTALIKSPKHPTEYLVTPVVPIAGIESPEVRQSGAVQLWQAAWEARAQLFRRLGQGLPANRVGLAVNSPQSRTQDEFHIHVDCASAAVRERLVEIGPMMTGEWRSVTGLARGEPYLATRFDGTSLKDVNVISLVAAHLPTGRHLQDASVAVIGIGSGEDATGFYILARFDGQAAEPLLDHACAR